MVSLSTFWFALIRLSVMILPRFLITKKPTLGCSSQTLSKSFLLIFAKVQLDNALTFAVRTSPSEKIDISPKEGDLHLKVS